jgi:hypothetical protein
MLGEMSQDEIRFLGEIRKYSTGLSDGDKKLVLELIRKMTQPQQRRPAPRRPIY